MAVVVICLLNVIPTFIESSPCNALPASIATSHEYMQWIKAYWNLSFIRELRAKGMYDSISALMVVGSEFFVF